MSNIWVTGEEFIKLAKNADVSDIILDIPKMDFIKLAKANNQKMSEITEYFVSRNFRSRDRLFFFIRKISEYRKKYEKSKSEDAKKWFYISLKAVKDERTSIARIKLPK